MFDRQIEVIMSRGGCLRPFGWLKVFASDVPAERLCISQFPAA